jgi:uncharacterized protein (DUF433 family)
MERFPWLDATWLTDPVRHAIQTVPHDELTLRADGTPRALSFGAKRAMLGSEAGRRCASMHAVATGHIHLDENDVAWIDDTNVKVIEVVLDKLAYGWSADEIHAQHSHLSLAQIHAALAYYYDHQVELDAEIDRREREVEAMMAQAGESPLRKQLREAGKLG